MVLAESKRTTVFDFEGRRYASEGVPGKSVAPCRVSLSGELFASSWPVSAFM